MYFKKKRPYVHNTQRRFLQRGPTLLRNKMIYFPSFFQITAERTATMYSIPSLTLRCISIITSEIAFSRWQSSLYKCGIIYFSLSTFYLFCFVYILTVQVV